MRQLTEKEAIALAETGVWRNWSDEDIVQFQLYQERLCMDFSRFHQAVEAVFGRPVYTHEFATPNWEAMQQEYEGKRPAPTFEEIVALLPQDKIIFVSLEKDE